MKIRSICFSSLVLAGVITQAANTISVDGTLELRPGGVRVDFSDHSRWNLVTGRDSDANTSGGTPQWTADGALAICTPTLGGSSAWFKDMVDLGSPWTMEFTVEPRDAYNKAKGLFIAFQNASNEMTCNRRYAYAAGSLLGATDMGGNLMGFAIYWSDRDYATKFNGNWIIYPRLNWIESVKYFDRDDDVDFAQLVDNDVDKVRGDVQRNPIHVRLDSDCRNIYCTVTQNGRTKTVNHSLFYTDHTRIKSRFSSTGLKAYVGICGNSQHDSGSLVVKDFKFTPLSQDKSAAVAVSGTIVLGREGYDCDFADASRPAWNLVKGFNDMEPVWYQGDLVINRKAEGGASAWYNEMVDLGRPWRLGFTLQPGGSYNSSDGFFLAFQNESPTMTVNDKYIQGNNGATFYGGKGMGGGMMGLALFYCDINWQTKFNNNWTCYPFLKWIGGNTYFDTNAQDVDFAEWVGNDRNAVVNDVQKNPISVELQGDPDAKTVKCIVRQNGREKVIHHDVFYTNNSRVFTRFANTDLKAYVGLCANSQSSGHEILIKDFYFENPSTPVSADYGFQIVLKDGATLETMAHKTTVDSVALEACASVTLKSAKAYREVEVNLGTVKVVGLAGEVILGAGASSLKLNTLDISAENGLLMVGGTGIVDSTKLTIVVNPRGRRETVALKFGEDVEWKEGVPEIEVKDTSGNAVVTPTPRWNASTGELVIPVPGLSILVR